MILGVASDCGSTNLRDIYGLILVGDVGMDRNFYALIRHGLISNYGSAF